MKFRALSLALLSTFATTVVGAQAPIGGLDGGRQTGLDSWTRQVMFSDNGFMEVDSDGVVLATTLTFFGAIVLAAGVRNYNSFGAPSLWNGSQEQAIGPRMTLQFERPVRGVAFNALFFEPPTSKRPVFEAALNKSDGSREVLRTFNASQPLLTDPSVFDNATTAQRAIDEAKLDWWGFDGGLFNELTIYAPFTRNDIDDFTYFSLGINNIRILDDPQPVQVPEPSTLTLLVAGLASMTYARHRRLRRAPTKS